MVSDDLGRQLHDRATRGELLSVEEQSLLKDWYVLQDSAESDALNLNKDTLATLQTQVEEALTQLTIVTKRIQEVASENKALKREIVELHRQLVYQPTVQLA